MITNISLITLYVTDQEESKKFYTEMLGFVVETDITMGEGFRWLTVMHPDHPELEVTLMVPGPPLDADLATAVSRALANGTMGGFGLRTDDCRKSYAELVAKGVDFVHPPADRPYGVEAVIRDNSGNWLVLVENKPYTGEDVPH